MAGSLSIEATKARRAAPFPHQKRPSPLCN
uniref:Uncharacterized protein n=1 Tax=Anguilla anguilla TaxID=7936 RepID=A0A0E9V8R4_ANGAN